MNWNSGNILVGILVSGLLLLLSIPSEGCVKKVTTVIQNYPRSTATNGSDLAQKLNGTVGSTVETPAELANDESVYTKYSHQTKQTGGSRFYLEIEESIDRSVKVYKMDKLPPMYSQIMDKNGTAGDSSSVGKVDSSPVEVIDVTGSSSPTPPSTTTTTTTEPEVDPKDEMVRKDWEGDCDYSRWSHCNQLRSITVMNVYNKTEGKEIKFVHLDMDCVSMKPTLCLRNKWTANKCHLICMSKCNKAILLGWEKFVSYERACKYV